MQPDQAVIDKWGSVAPFWEKYRETIRHMFGPVTQALVEDARIAAGHSVLDIATGPGEPALSISALVGPEGKVVGIDPVPQMIAVARRAAARSAFKNIQFEIAPAQRLPFPPDSFHAVVSRFGAMFFPSPVDAVREMLRVLQSGGNLSLAVWGFSERNPFFEVLSRVLDPYVGPTPPVPDDQDAFRFAAPGKLLDVLRQAGALSPSERLLEFAIQAAISPEEFWTLRSEMSERFREKVARLSAAQLAELKPRALEALREYSTDRGVSFPAQVLIVTGTKN